MHASPCYRLVAEAGFGVSKTAPNTYPTDKIAKLLRILPQAEPQRSLPRPELHHWHNAQSQHRLPCSGAGNSSPHHRNSLPNAGLQPFELDVTRSDRSLTRPAMGKDYGGRPHIEARNTFQPRPTGPKRSQVQNIGMKKACIHLINEYRLLSTYSGGGCVRLTNV